MPARTDARRDAPAYTLHLGRDAHRSSGRVLLSGGYDVVGPRASRSACGWEGHWWLGGTTGWGEPWTSKARGPGDVDGEGDTPPSTRHTRDHAARDKYGPSTRPSVMRTTGSRFLTDTLRIASG